jgi:hypothetical protein
MNPAPLRYGDYLKAAFGLKVPIKGLGALPLNKLMLAGFAILGIGHPGFWLLGLALETAYLMVLSGNRRFQQWVGLGRRMDTRSTWAEREQRLLSTLDREAQERFLRLGERCRQLMRLTEGSAAGFSGLEAFKASGLDQLSAIFLNLLASRQRTAEMLRKTPPEALAAEIDALRRQLAATEESAAVHRSLRGTLEIQERRQENLLKAREALGVTEAELERIEKQVALLTEETALSASPEILSVRLDGVMETLRGTSQWMAEQGDLFGPLEGGPPPQRESA